ncbi:MAG: hypothetical protein LC751_19930 [Actinobacteria bacterium]|nr:hypothetical protein [Actinomycetota bacterium]
MDTRDQRTLSGYSSPPDEHYQEPGLGAWIKRNSWLLVRLFVVMVFTFGASTTAGDTGGNLLIQQTTKPDLTETGEQVWHGKLATVGTVIFHNTTQSGLEAAGLPRDESIPVIETGDTPEYYRQIFPAYSVIMGLWVLSIAWLIWKKNKPFLREDAEKLHKEEIQDP